MGTREHRKKDRAVADRKQGGQDRVRWREGERGQGRERCRNRSGGPGVGAGAVRADQW